MMGYLVFGLVLIRCSGLAVFAPYFGAEQFPVVARIGMAGFFALLLYPLAAPTAVLPPVLNASALMILAVQELAIGLVVGFFSSLVFMGAQLAGQLVGQQIGFAMANVIDPLTSQEVSIIGFFKLNLAILIFLILNLHHAVIAIIRNSFEYVGIGQLAFGRFAWSVNLFAHGGDSGFGDITGQAEMLFIVAVQLAMPVLLVMLLNSVVEGFVTRTMPQMNIMVLGLPLRVTLGLTALLFVVRPLVYAMEGVLTWMVENLDEMMHVMGG